MLITYCREIFEAVELSEGHEEHSGIVNPQMHTGQQSVVHVLGTLAIAPADGQVFKTVPSGRASLLLSRLVAAAGANVTVDAAIEALWPTDPPATASRTVASLVSRIRTALSADVIEGSSATGYRFGAGPSWTSDVMLAERLILEAQSHSSNAPALAAASAQRGLVILDRGKPLNAGQGLDAEWVDELKRHVGTLRRHLQLCLWDANIELCRWSELLNAADAALAVEPHDEAAGRALMIAHWNRGDRGAALTTHDRLRERLLAELGVEPSTETDSLYSAILRDDHAAAVTKRERPLTSSSHAHLAGRDAELHQLVECWNTAATGNLVSVVVSGPAGSGGSLLCLTLADIVERTGGQVLRAVNGEGERSLFLHPILTMINDAVLSTAAVDIPVLLGPFIGTAAELIPELRSVCTVAPYERASADLEHRRALLAIKHIFATLSRQHPLLLIFDDLHHASASTIEALQWLRQELKSDPVLLLSTVHADHGDRLLEKFASQSTSISLKPISKEGVAEIVTAAGFADEIDFVWELTQGHLLFVTSVIGALQQGVQKDSIAGSIGSVVLDSSRRAGANVHAMLQVSSVIGMSFDLSTLTRVSDDSPFELMKNLEAAVAATLIEARDDGFTFSNRVIQQVLYDSIVGPIRRERHRRLADESLDNPERRAWHLSRAGLPEDASRAWLEAAQHAQRAFLNRDADRLFTEAISAAEGSTDGAIRGEALLGRGIVRTELGDYDRASNDHLEAERFALSMGDTRLRARAVERHAWNAYYERDVATAIARAEEATTIPGAHPSAWVLLGRTRHWAGDFTTATTAYRRALDELGDDEAATKASALSCLGALLAHGDHYAEAIDVLEESVALCHEIGAFRPLLRSLFFEGLARANAGDLSGALTTFETKSTLLERYDVSFYRARTKTCLAWIWRELGDHRRSQSLSELALAESREVDDGELQVEQELHALCSLAECAIVAGDLDGADNYLSSAHDLLSQWLPFRWRAELRVTELQSRIGVASPEELLNDARDRGSAKYEALALHLLGRPREAGAIAATTASSLLIAEVGEPVAAKAAKANLVARLPRQLRAGFFSDGRLANYAKRR